MSYDFSAVKNRISIDSLFREDGHELKKRGSKYVCLSPFNAERTPSCYVDPDRGRFKCFSSGASGDIFDYVMLFRNCAKDDAMAFLANRAGIDFSSARPLPPLPKKPVLSLAQEKALVAITLEDKAIWDEGVDWLIQSAAACSSIAAWRGFSARSVRDLAAHGKIGVPKMTPWLLRQDREPGDRRVAFPVDGMVNGEILQVAYHIRLKPRTGEKKASWRFVPTGVGAWPYVLGKMEKVKFLILCEGQWDAMAMFDALGVSYAEMLQEQVAIVGLRGAQNWRLFLEHYMLLADGLPSHPDLRCLVVCDADEAGETWTTANGDEPSLVELLQAICRKVYVREPLEGLGKDLNDVWKAVSTAANQVQSQQREPERCFKNGR